MHLPIGKWESLDLDPEKTSSPRLHESNLDWIAQLVEHRTFNPRVVGSNPAPVMAKRLHELLIHSDSGLTI